MTIGDKILQAIMGGGLVRVSIALGQAHSCDESECDEILNPRVVFVWSANAASQLEALVNNEQDYPCECGKRLPKHGCIDCGYAAMVKSREERDW